METITKAQGDEIIALLKQLIAKTGSGGASSGDPNFKEGVFTGWRAVRIHFGFDRGVQLGDLGTKGFDYFMTSWTPREPVKPEDTALQNAIKEAKAEILAGTFTPLKYTNKPRDDKKPAPRGGGSRPTPPPQDDDTDVPF